MFLSRRLPVCSFCIIKSLPILTEFSAHEVMPLYLYICACTSEKLIKSAGCEQFIIVMADFYKYA